MAVPMPQFAQTNIQSPGQIYIPSVSSSRGGGGPSNPGLDLALGIGKLQELNEERQKKTALKDAISSSYQTKEGPDGQTLTEFDPGRYVQNLQAIDPKAAQAYAQGQQTIQHNAVALQSADIDLKDKQRHQAAIGLNEGFRYFKATSGEDVQGTINMINPMLPKDADSQIKNLKLLKNGNVQVEHVDGSKMTLNDEKMQQIGVKAETASALWTNLQSDRERLAAAKDKPGAKAIPRTPTNREVAIEAESLANTPAYTSLSKEDRDVFASDLAQGIIHAQVAAKNNNEEIPDAATARQQVLYQLEKRYVPSVTSEHSFLGVKYNTTSRDAMYFQNVAQLNGAVTAGKLDKTEAARLLREGFPEEAKRRLAELKAKK